MTNFTRKQQFLGSANHETSLRPFLASYIAYGRPRNTLGHIHRNGLHLSTPVQAAVGFSTQLREKHARHCPWRGTACTAQLPSFPPQGSATVADAFMDRVSELAALETLPPISQKAVTAMEATHEPQLRHLLTQGTAISSQPGSASLGSSPHPAAAEPSSAATEAGRVNGGGEGPSGGVQGVEEVLSTLGNVSRGEPGFQQRQYLLAACGWNTRIMPSAPRDTTASITSGSTPPAAGGGEGPAAAATSSSQAILYCTMCGAKHGMWTFLGGTPVVPSKKLSASAPLPTHPPTVTPESLAAQTLPSTPVTTSAHPRGSMGSLTAPSKLQGSEATPVEASTPRSVPARASTGLLDRLRGATIAGGNRRSSTGEAAAAMTAAISGPFGSKTSSKGVTLVTLDSASNQGIVRSAWQNFWPAPRFSHH